MSTAITLEGLNRVVQAAVGWMDLHLWEFVIGGQTYGLSMDEDWGTAPRADAAGVRLREVLKGARTAMTYTYDFGDGWEHSLVVSGVRPGAVGVRYPRLVAGERNGPPEDCGGIPGFYALLDARADPAAADHDDAIERLGDYDPDDLEEAYIAGALGAIGGHMEPTAAGWIRRPDG